MELLRYALAQARGGWRRSLAAFLATFTAVTSFVLLTGAATTQRLEATHTLEANFRGAYDILVRPAGSTTPLEAENAQVRSTFLSGVYGGITLDQVDQIEQVPGTEAAAPIVMLGTTNVPVALSLDIDDLIPTDQERAVVRFSTDAVARNGHLTLPAQTGYLYVTRQPFTFGDHVVHNEDGSTSLMHDTAIEEVDGVPRYPCFLRPESFESYGEVDRTLACYSLASREGRPGWLFAERRAALPVVMSYPITVAAVDPDAESRLLGLDDAVVAGRPLTAADTWTGGVYHPPPLAQTLDEPAFFGEGSHRPYAPALLALGESPDFALRFTLQALPPAAAESWVRIDTSTGLQEHALLREAPVVGAAQTRSIEGAEIYERVIAGVPPSEGWVENDRWDVEPVPTASLHVFDMMRAGEVGFAPGTPLTALQAADPELDSALRPTLTMADTAFRPVRTFRAGLREVSSQACELSPDACYHGLGLQVVGHFDPTRLREGGELGRVPLETYTAADLLPADDATRAVTGDSLRSDLNPAGYAQMPPSLVIPIAALPMFEATRGEVPIGDAPVSAVRVRVADITDFSDASLERIRLVAERIQHATGLDVDIMVGTSQLPQRVELPATRRGVPALHLDEMWSKKGVAVMIRDAVDAKSVLLFGLILASSALTLAVVARSSVAARRRELGVLKASGWPASQLTGALLVEAGLVGLAAGAVGAVVAWPLTALFGVAFDPVRALVAIPTAVVLSVLASLPAAIDAGRLSPIAALTPPVVGGRRALLRVRGPVGLGVVTALRRPGRLLAGSLAVALGVGSLVFLLTIAQQFAGAVVGTVLGDAIAVQVRSADIAAAIMLAVMALIAVGVILFLGLTEDARGYASLSASGWRDGALGVAVVAQGVLIALVGTLVGVGAAHLTLDQVVGVPAPGVWQLGGMIGGAAVVLAGVVALAPALSLRRLPIARLLARD